MSRVGGGGEGHSRDIVLTVSPHPDDEVLGLGATMAMLIDKGWTMRNLACSLGHVEDHPRRRRELREAGAILGYETTEMQPLAALSRDDNLRGSALTVARAVADMIETWAPAIVVSPHLGDGHHGHEAVAQGVRLALEASTNGPRWWSYGIWADLPRPNIYVPYDETTMRRITAAIAAYTGENERSNYDLMYPARAVVHRTIGSEKVFGFGTATASALPYADLVTELRHTDKGWQYAAPRAFQPESPLDGSWLTRDIAWWIRQPSLREQWGRPA